MYKQEEAEGLTFGIGIGSEVAASPRSSTMFLMRTERSATSRSGALVS